MRGIQWGKGSDHPSFIINSDYKTSSIGITTVINFSNQLLRLIRTNPIVHPLSKVRWDLWDADRTAASSPPDRHEVYDIQLIHHPDTHIQTVESRSLRRDYSLTGCYLIHLSLDLTSPPQWSSLPRKVTSSSSLRTLIWSAALLSWAYTQRPWFHPFLVHP